MEKEVKLTKRNIRDIYEAKMRKALCFVERTKDTESFFSNGITVSVNKQWAVVSRMYIRTVYSSESVNYGLLNMILGLQKKQENGDELSEEDEMALKNGLLWIQSLVISDNYHVIDLAFKQLVDYLDYQENLLKEVEAANTPDTDKDALSDLMRDETIKEQLKQEMENGK